MQIQPRKIYSKPDPQKNFQITRRLLRCMHLSGYGARSPAIPRSNVPQKFVSPRGTYVTYLPLISAPDTVFLAKQSVQTSSATRQV